MRDEGLRLAIEAAGGVGALARSLGIRQPLVSSWVRVPADRVVAVESLTGVDRQSLRPDLYAPALEDLDPLPPAQPIDHIELARAFHYLLLAKLLRSAPSASFLSELRNLSGDGSPLGLARIELAEAAGRVNEADAGHEFFALFIGIGRGEILPYGSFYQTGFLHERPLSRLRQDLGRLGIERRDGNFDPEDHLGLLCEMMGGFADGTFTGDLPAQKAFFDVHLAPWAARAFDDVASAPSSRFYKAVAHLGRAFVDIESEAFEIETPVDTREQLSHDQVETTATQ